MTDRHSADTINSDALDQLYDQLDRVRALHHPTGVVAAAEHGNPPGCAVCGPFCWPCPTYQAVDTPGPAATEATEPHTGLVVQPYRNDRGENAWVFRCWGTDDGCDGWLSLDHYSEQSAERARDRHFAEEHPNEETPMPDKPTCTATIDGPHVLGGGPIQCTREAGHPENHVGPKRGDYGRTLWTDHTAGATRHGASSEEQPS